MNCAPGPTPATGSLPRGWPTCWPSVAPELARGSAAELDAATAGPLSRLADRRRAGEHPAASCLPGSRPGRGSCAATLPGWSSPRRPGPGRPAAGDDAELAAVAAELRGLDGDGSRMAAAIRGALDMLLDGQHTGRYRWDQLHKTEKTHAGTLVEIALARTLRLADGAALDYTIAGADVDCKFSHRLGGWMIPPEADGKLMLLVQASDEDGTWSAGLLRAAAENLRPAGNRDGKRALNDRGRAAVRWLHARAPLQENALIRLPGRDVAAIFARPSGQQRVNELFRRAQRMRVSRTVVATVAMQDDYMKRVRGGGGARDQLRAEGIVIFGDYAGDQVLASALGLPRPGPGEFVSARLAPRAAWRRPRVPGLRPFHPACRRRLAARERGRSGWARARPAGENVTQSIRGNGPLSLITPAAQRPAVLTDRIFVSVTLDALLSVIGRRRRDF